MRYIVIILCVLVSDSLSAQSIHQQQLKEYNATGKILASEYEVLPARTMEHAKLNCTLEKVVYGWHPYWVGSAYTNYQWDLLSHLSFFSYEVDANDGNAITTHGWNTSAAVDAALNSGNTKVTLCVTLFSNHATFFGNPTAQQTLITNLINLVQSRGAHGVNIDFEGIPSSQATNFSNFMVDLANQMHAAIPGSEVSTVLYAVDWNGVFDFSILEPSVDQYIIMGYGYYYTGSSNAGPTDPLYHFGPTYNYTLSRTVSYYLDQGVPNDKLILGLPSYGYEWPTTSATIPSPTTGSGTARTYSFIMDNTSGNYSVGNHTWEGDSQSDNYTFNSGGTRQCFISQDSALRKRLEHVRNTGIGGIGIWALGYDDGYSELWNAMNDYLTDCYTQPCSGIVHDFGGPTRNYYNNEDYTWTVAPPNAVSLDFDFTEFDVELNYDYLYIFDGPDALSPQIPGSPFTGTTGPGQFTTTTGTITFRFTSDGATVTPGFLANYTCNTVPAPIAEFTVSNTNICIGDSIQLINTSSDAESIFWTTTSGGLSSTTNDTTYLFPGTSGSYTVTLEVMNISGTDQLSIPLSVIVQQPPIAAASLSDINLTMPNAIVYFTNYSQNASGYIWNFGDGTSSNDSNPWHEYSQTGIYDGYLVAMGGSCPNDTMYFQVNVGTTGIIASSSSEIKVYPNPFTNELTLLGLDFDQIELVDVSGRLVPIRIQTIQPGESLIGVDAAPGTYFLYVLSGDFKKVFSLVKQ